MLHKDSTHLLQVFVTVDELALMGVLELVGLDVLPQSLNDDRSGLGVDTQHTSQPGVQLELRWLFGTQKNKDGNEEWSRATNKSAVRR